MEERYVVVSGVSSGMGRAVALGLAESGCSMLLVGGRESGLDQLAAECRHAGARTIAVWSDMGGVDESDRVAARAVDAFGRIDAWINCTGAPRAGVAAETAEDERLVGQNLIAAMNGARQAVGVFRRQRRGVLVNLCETPTEESPLAPMCAAARAGLRGVSETLRRQLHACRLWDVHVCDMTVRPDGIEGGRAAVIASLGASLRGVLDCPKVEMSVPQEVFADDLHETACPGRHALDDVSEARRENELLHVN